jgi:hypothetical protein
MTISMLSGPSRRFLLNRIERLRESMENLGERLRESISQIISTQVGEAIREVLDSLLHIKPSRSSPEYRRDDSRYDPHREYPPNWYGYEAGQGDGFWNDREEPEEPEPEVEPERKPSRWKSLLTGLVQLAAWWFERGPKRPSLKRLLGIGAIVGAATMMGGPVAGGVAMTVGTAALLTSSSASLPVRE